MTLIAARLIDVAIFGSLGTLWIGGLVFIVTLYRWLLRYEREREPMAPDAVPVTVDESEPVPVRLPPRALPSTAAAREALAAHS